ncbi:hypothetical protein BDF20DRAFT_835870 [Mycotypha africana]|uniref:uncharacterized protein n=1 Tax=Mycotypha africana TaxID=64632 RepID=UPI0023017C7B|nr:uncharacterized protein BDF20DRAFT_835870 [Mycotypha africana]KAI8977035.1 hypothetical protein BDF20DRAFT_835870 [Mycotypha africana]
MSLFERALANVVSQATGDYASIAQNDPVVISGEDGTTRGDYLDLLQEAQRKERKKLWDQVYRLEEEQKQRVFSSNNDENPMNKVETDASRKKLATLMYQYSDLEREVAAERGRFGEECENRPEDTILEIEFREQLDQQIQQYNQAIDFLKEDLRNVKETLKLEKKALSECTELYTALKAKEKEIIEENNLAREVNPDQLRESQAILENMFKNDQDDLIDFLDEYYPPHPVDESTGILDAESDLKNILEDLMNKALGTPEDPYIELVPGTYWTPYIQTLVKANILKFHPEDSKMVRLEDFR